MILRPNVESGYFIVAADFRLSYQLLDKGLTHINFGTGAQAAGHHVVFVIGQRYVRVHHGAVVLDADVAR